jgi:cation:H+ antiporter
LAYLQIVLGFALLFGGGELLIRGAVDLAQRFGVSPLLLGATVVAIGTSAPELAVSVRAVAGGHPALALGSVIGSNVANVLLILGVAAIVAPIAWSRRAVLRDAMGLVLASVFFAAIASTGRIGRLEGLAMLALLAALIAVNTWRERRKRALTLSLLEEEAAELGAGGRSLRRSAAITLIGVGGVVVGADQLVAGASQAALAFGVSEGTIGLTLVAVGTSLPELATCVIAAWRKHADLALGNVVGSNVFNQLGIAGTASLVGPIRVSREFLASDLWVMLALMVATSALLVLWGRLDRREGVLFVAVYAAWVLGRS